MATTCKLIAKVVLGSSATTIDFTSIPGTYTDLMLVYSLRNDGSVASGFLSFNGSTSNFSAIYLLGNGSTASSGSFARYYGTVQGTTGGLTASTFSNGEIYIPNYAGSTNKSYSTSDVRPNNSTAGDCAVVAGLWSNTAAITSIRLGLNTADNLVSGSSAYLYGISRA